MRHSTSRLYRLTNKRLSIYRMSFRHEKHDEIAAGSLPGHPESAYRDMKQHLLHSWALIIHSI